MARPDPGGGVPWADGEYLPAVAPHTEADSAALFAHVITGAGVLVGKEAYALVGDAPHPPRLNAVVAGATAHGRKGTAGRNAERVLVLAKPAFAACGPGARVRGYGPAKLGPTIRPSIEATACVAVAAGTFLRPLLC